MIAKIMGRGNQSIMKSQFLICLLVTLVVALATSPDSVSAESGVCSWYGVGLDGALTASGERYNGKLLTAAHKTLPFGTMVRATIDGRSVVVRVNDRGPFVPGRILDLSIAAAKQVNIIDRGVGNCKVDRV